MLERSREAVDTEEPPEPATIGSTLKNSATDSVQFLYMHSFGRSGETLLMRCLDAHPQIHALVQLLNRSDESVENYQLYRRLTMSSLSSLRIGHRLLKPVVHGGKPVIVVKAADWLPSQNVPGFVLIRNPFSVVSSYLKLLASKEWRQKRKIRLQWLSRIDQDMTRFLSETDVVTAICVAWNRRYAGLSRTWMPVIRYEDMVHDPEAELRRLMQGLRLPWAGEMLKSEENYVPGQIGHGGIILSQPIGTGSLDSWKSLDEKEKRKIRAICYPVMQGFGYELLNGELITAPQGGVSR